MKNETAIEILNQAIALKDKQAGEFERAPAGSALEKADNHGRALRLRGEVAEIEESVKILTADSANGRE